MYRFVLIFLFYSFGMTLNCQTLETGIAINKTHLWYARNYEALINQKDKLGISLIARYQNPAAFFMLRNNEACIEYCRGQIDISEHGSAASGSGPSIDIMYKNLSITLNNYMVNFGTLTKGFQVSLGMHYNYKIWIQSNGYFSIPYHVWDPTMGAYRFLASYYNLDGKNNKYIRRFNLGPCLGIGFRTFKLGNLTVRSRYDISTGLGYEIKQAPAFNYFRQRFTFSIVKGDIHSKKIVDKLKILEDKKIKKTTTRELDRISRKLIKPSVIDKNLEMGGGFNLYHFKLRKNNYVNSRNDLSFGLGIRIWDWKTKKKLPAVSINFQQVMFFIPYKLSKTTISGQFQRNTFSLGLYPLKLLFAKKRIDIRGGLDFGFLINAKAKGIYQQVDPKNGNLVKNLEFKSDIYGYNQKITICPLLTISGPMIRRNNYCIKWRATMAYNFADLIVDGLWGNGIRMQSEMVLCKSIF